MLQNFSVRLQQALDSGELLELLDSSKTLADIALKLGYSTHGRNTGAITVFLKRNNLEFKNHTQKTKEFIDKVCVYCGSIFQVSAHDKNSLKQLTCSHDCSSNYPEFKEKRVLNKLGGPASSYRIVAKHNGLTSCCICKEDKVIDIHHLDENPENNDISNLVPLCPTHHAYMHRGKSDLIMEKLVEYLDTRF